MNQQQYFGKTMPVRDFLWFCVVCTCFALALATAFALTGFAFAEDISRENKLILGGATLVFSIASGAALVYATRRATDFITKTTDSLPVV